MKITGIMVSVECTKCLGDGRVSGGRYEEEDELIACPTCNGEGYVVQRAGLDQVVEAIADFLAHHGSIVQRAYQKIRWHIGGGR